MGDKIFSGCGKVVEVPERYFDLVTAISGSGPAYFFLLMELLADVGKQMGLSAKTAELFAVQTAFGAAKLAQHSAHSPSRLREMVTSKKGTTDAALSHFQKKGFSNIFVEGVRRAMARAKELSKG
jgi:pyrroline-5-carboxylate reductase